MFSLRTCNFLQIMCLISMHEKSIFTIQVELSQPPREQLSMCSIYGDGSWVMTQLPWMCTIFKNIWQFTCSFLFYWFTHVKRGHVNDQIYTNILKDKNDNSIQSEKSNFNHGIFYLVQWLETATPIITIRYCHQAKWSLNTTSRFTLFLPNAFIFLLEMFTKSYC